MSFVRLLLVVSVVLLCHTGRAGSARAQTSPDSTVTTVSGGYDPAVGLFFEDAAAGFRANLGAYAQFRYTMNWRDGAQDSTESFEQGYSMPRAELFLFGNYKEKLAYHFRALIEEATDFSLYVAYLQYQISDRWNVTAGKQFIPLSREDWYYAQDLLAMDFSANDNTFAVGTSLGVVFQNVASDRFRMWLGVSNGAFSAKRSFPPVAESDVLVNGRFEFQVAGTDWSVWDDMIGRRGRPFGVLVGLGPGYLVRERRDMEVRRQGQVNLDLSVNGDGYQAMLAGSWTRSDPVGDVSYNSYGFYAQGGYFLTDTWQAYVRYDFVSPGDQPGDLENFNAASVGVNWLPFSSTNRWKISGELGRTFGTLDNTIVQPSGNLGWLDSDQAGQTLLRLQAQFGF